MLKCGITGATGNLGKTFVKNYKQFKYIKFSGDITKKKDVNEWIKYNEFDLIIHFAALVPISIVNRQYQKALKTNYIGTKYLIDSIIKNQKKIEWFFFSSTSHVYPFKLNPIKENHTVKPISKYGKSKQLAEKYIINKLEKTKIKFCIGRIFSIFNNTGKDFFLKSLIKKLDITENKIVLKNMNHYRDFLTTQEISKIIIKLSKKKYEGIINIGSGKKTNLKEVSRIFALKLKKKITFFDNDLTCSLSNNMKLKKLGFKFKKLNIRKQFDLVHYKK